jgi:hypothetical protein
MQDCVFGCKSFIDALGFADVREALMELDNNWNNWEPWQRGEVLIELVMCGCSVQGLSTLLQCSSWTVNRCMDLADRRLFLAEGRAGFTPERFFRDWKRLERRRAKKHAAMQKAAPAQGPPASLEAVPKDYHQQNV